MNALFVKDHGQPCFTILHGTLPPPSAPQKGHVVIRVHAAGVTTEDLEMMKGWQSGDARIPGREAAGVVEAVGEDVELKVGDRVVGFVEGAWAELASVKENMVVRLPEHIGFAEGVALLPAAMLAMKAKEIGGGNGVVAGGAAGCVLVQMLGRGSIVAVEGEEEEEMVKKMDVERIVNREKENVADVLSERVDVVYDFVGAAHRLGKIVKRGGCIVRVGGTLNERQTKKLNEVCRKTGATVVEVTLQDMKGRVKEMEDVLKGLRAAYGPCYGVKEYVRAMGRVQEGLKWGKVILLM